VGVHGPVSFFLPRVCRWRFVGLRSLITGFSSSDFLARVPFVDDSKSAFVDGGGEFLLRSPSLPLFKSFPRLACLSFWSSSVFGRFFFSARVL